MQILLLQKPFAKRNAKGHVSHLQRRLTSWNKGYIETLLAEGRCIQVHLPNGLVSMDESVTRTFSKMMFTGNVRGALNYLSRKSTGVPLKLDDIISTKEGALKLLGKLYLLFILTSSQ